ncbi:MAG TPA: serine/threonine-protein kinase, partial [Gemmataceae bacterium]|nr:serine/threonine-protein kinase [Gemmataceae bacterium]
MDNLSNVEAIFFAALEKGSSEERAAYVDEVCAGDQELRRCIERLLSAHPEVGSFLQSASLAGTADEPPNTEGPGTNIGPYKLLQRLGEGGMGTVYMAEQEVPIRRLVAVKIIKSGGDSAEVLARFEAERQALALMEHPNVAKVLDAGATGSGLPYFVMELIHGIPITDYCNQRRLSLRARLELFVPVCQAVQHAHQKGIIHRDLKPSNVLIALYDDRPVPKVIDFGVAKATAQKLTERTLVTRFGTLVGTLEYMSPEQAELNQLDIDTRSDVYSLGVLLYELLTGKTPLDRQRLKEVGLLEMLRRIREEEPQTPSDRLRSAAELPAFSEQRSMEPARLARLVRGELDWIVMQTLEKDRGRRYATAAGLAEDIQRYLHDEPVAAVPPSAGYRLHKFLKRKRGPVLAAAGVLVALVAGFIGTTLGLKHALQSKDVAQGLARDLEEALKESQKNERAAKVQALRAGSARHAIQLDLALRAWERHDVGEAERVLGEVEPAFQQTWEQRHLRDLCRRKVLHLQGHAARITAVMFSADGQRMVSQSSDGMVKVWDTATGEEKLNLRCEVGEAINLAFSTDGRRLATRHPDGTLKVWDAVTGEEKLTLKAQQRVEHGLGSYSTRIAFSPDGRWIAAGKSDGTVRVWDAATGQEKLPLKGAFLAFSGDGQRIATSSEDQTVRVWDTATGRKTLSRTVHLFAEGRGLVEDQKVEVYSAAFSPDCGSIVLGCRDSTVRVWDTATGKEQFILQHSNKGHANPVVSVAV